MIAITTSNSISVKPLVLGELRSMNRPSLSRDQMERTGKTREILPHGPQRVIWSGGNSFGASATLIFQAEVSRFA